MKSQRGGTLIGLIVGLVLGLGVALAVALYVSKVPVPFVDKLPQRTADQDSAEAERNKNWNPNAPLAGKAGVPAPAASAPAAEGDGAAAPTATGTAAAGSAAPNAAAPAAAGATPGRSPAAPDPRPEVTGLFIQAGAFSKAEDAEQQRARLAMLGFAARISEREQGGRPVFRVRVGPYETRDETQGPMDRLQAAGIEVSLVRVERSATP
ncbi:MAG: SPOR domain-containing protein [Betaproteobacteria bacterium]